MFQSCTALIALILSIFLTCPVLASGSPDSAWSANARQLTTEIDKLRQRLKIPEMALAIVHDGVVIHAADLGPQRDGLAFTVSTPWSRPRSSD